MRSNRTDRLCAQSLLLPGDDFRTPKTAPSCSATTTSSASSCLVRPLERLSPLASADDPAPPVRASSAEELEAKATELVTYKRPLVKVCSPTLLLGFCVQLTGLALQYGPNDVPWQQELFLKDD